MSMELARNWRLRRARYALEGSKCEDCGKVLFPARALCPGCRSRGVAPYRFSGHGEVYSFSTVHQPPSGFEGQAPYVVALVRLDEGPLVTAQLTDVAPDAVYVGLRVEMVTRKLYEYGDSGVIVYGYKFRPPVTVWSNGHRAAEALALTEPQAEAPAPVYVGN